MATKTLRPKRSTRLSAFFLDALLLGFASTVINFITTPIALSLPVAKEIVTSLSNSQEDLAEIIVSSRLNSLTEDKRFQTQNHMADQYILSLAKGSLMHYGATEETLSSIYANIAPAHEDNDRAYYYFVTFKEDHSKDFSVQGLHGLSSYRSELTKDLENEFTGDGYPYLTEKAAKNLDEGLRDSSFEIGKNLMKQLKNRYVSLLQKGAEDLSKNYMPYIEKESVYRKAERNYLNFQCVCVMISTFLSASILLFVLPLCSEGATLGEKVMKIRHVDQKEEFPSPARIILQRVFFPFFIPAISIFPMLLTPGYGMALLNLPIAGPLTIKTFAAIGIILLLIDYIFTFFKDHDTGLELLSRTHLAIKEVPHELP